MSKEKLVHSDEDDETNIAVDERENEDDDVPDDSDDDTLICSSSVLAAQIRKVIPSVRFANRSSSISLYPENASEMSLKKKKSSNASLKESDSSVKNGLSFSNIKRTNVTSDVEINEMLTSAQEGGQVMDESVIRNIPVPLDEKRRRRNTIMVFTKNSRSERLKNYFTNISGKLSEFQLWHEHLKVIEGRFGASVLSYFLFIRWLLIMNIIIFVLNFFFIVLPQVSLKSGKLQIHLNLTRNETKAANFSVIRGVIESIKLDRKLYELNHEALPKTDFLSEPNYSQFESLSDATINNTNISIDLIKYCHKKYVAHIESMKHTGFLATIQNTLQGTGWLEGTVLFIGYYTKEEFFFFGRMYQMSLAFIWVFIICFIISFIMMVQYSSSGIKETFMTFHDMHRFSNELISGWDYCITSPKSSELHHDKFVVELKSNLSEARRRKEISSRTTIAWVELNFTRILVNIIVIVFIIGCYWLIYYVALFQIREMKSKKLKKTGFRILMIQYLSPFTILLISSLSPYLFDFLVSFERFHGQKVVNVSLIRNAFLFLSSIILLISTFYIQITCEPRDICGSGKKIFGCQTPRCWETYVGQQLYKLSLFQLILIFGTFLLFDIPRYYIVTKCDNKFTRCVGCTPFFLPTEVLLPIYNQTILWLGVLYSPLLPAIAVIQLICLFYIKKAMILKFSEPSTALYKASRFNSAFINILMISFLAVLTVHLYTLVRIRPSLGCSPFRDFNSMIIALKIAFQFLPFDLIEVCTFLFSGWFFIPIAILMCTFIYYYWNYTNSLKQLEQSLKADLILQSQDKQFLIKTLGDKVEKPD